MHDATHLTVAHFLTQAYQLPCSTAAGAFAHLVPSISRFQLALESLFPRLSSGDPSSADWQHELATRILVAYILYALYAPHPMSNNPFREVLLDTFVAERDKLVSNSSRGNEQLVWVLWKILKGDGNDIGPFSPSTLASSPLPSPLKAAHLSLDDEPLSSRPRARSSPSNEDDYGSDRVILPGSPPPPRLASLGQQSEQATALSLLLAARTRTLSFGELRQVSPHLKTILFQQMDGSSSSSSSNLTCVLVPSQDLPPLIDHNPPSSSLSLTIVKLLLLNTFSDVVKLETEHVLISLLPPTLPTFDMWGRLLRDEELASSPMMAVKLRKELLPLFLAHAMSVLASWERRGAAEGDGELEIKWERGVRLFCRFVVSMVKAGVISVGSREGEEEDGGMEVAELQNFALEHSRFEDAIEVYGILVGGQGDGR